MEKRQKKTKRGPWKRELASKLGELESQNLALADKVGELKGYIDSFMANVPISILGVNENLRVTFANRNFYRKTRKSPDEVIGSDINSVFPYRFVKGLRLDSKVGDVIKKGLIEEGEIGYRGFIYHYHIVPLPARPREERSVLLVLDDITQERYLGEEVRKIERHLTNVVESADDLVFSADIRGGILTWNEAAVENLGYSFEEVQHTTFPSLFSKEDRKKIRDLFRKLRLRKRKREVAIYEIGMPRKDGREALISWTFGVIRDDQGRPTGLMGVGRDLTEKRRLEAQLVQSAKLASLGTMAGGIAHELRNPLAIASGAAQFLLRKEDESFIKECSQKIYSSITRASEIIENLLRFSQASGLGVGPIDINSALEETLSLVAHQISLRKVRIVKDLSPEMPEVEVNKNRIQQVFMNMILNAADAIKDGGDLRIETRNNDGREIIIKFQDTGCGIPRENIDRIFDPFFTTKPHEKNTGLGLFISYGIVQEHGGRIDVESEVGKGTTFSVSLPAFEEKERDRQREREKKSLLRRERSKARD